MTREERIAMLHKTIVEATYVMRPTFRVPSLAFANELEHQLADIVIEKLDESGFWLGL